MNRINLLIVTFFWIGKIKFAPGTCASFVATIILFSLFNLFFLNPIVILIVIILLFFYSFIAIKNTLKEFKNDDPKEIVIDEVLGQSIPVILYEFAHGPTTLSFDKVVPYFFMFLAFRMFDIFKPFPINYFDKKFKNSFGIIMDDIIAGIYSTILLVLLMIFNSRI